MIKESDPSIAMKRKTNKDGIKCELLMDIGTS